MTEDELLHFNPLIAKAFTQFEAENARDRYRRPQDRRGPREDLCDHQDWPDVDQGQYAVFDAG